MRDTNSFTKRLQVGAATVLASLLGCGAQAAVPGITGGAATPSFDLVATPGYVSQPDGASVYVWGYGCNTQPSGSAPVTVPLPSAGCPKMQLPGPTLIVNQGDTVKVTLTNNLPLAAGNTSILFPGFHVTAVGGRAGRPHAGGDHGCHRHLHLHGGHRRHPLLLQRHAGRPAGRDGPVRCHHRAAQHRRRRSHGLLSARIGVAQHMLRAKLEAGHAGSHRLPPGRCGVRPSVRLLRPRVPVPVLGDGSCDPSAGPAAVRAGRARSPPAACPSQPSPTIRRTF